MGKKGISSQSSWESAGTKIGVISGIIGIALSIPSIISAFKPDKKDDLQTQELELTLNEYEPRLEVSYVDVWGDIYENARYSNTETDKKEGFFLDYKSVASEISISDTSSLNIPENEVEYLHTIYLMVQNNGKSAAMEIELDVNRCILNQPIQIIENFAGNSDDYQTKIETAAIEQKTIPIKIPLSLETGKGILIPLMISETKYSSASPVSPTRKWNIISKIAYLPSTIRYKSSINGKVTEKKVRKMLHPVRLSGGIEIRG